MTSSPLELLDDPAALEAGDRSGVLRATASAAAQVREAVVLSAEAGIARFADQDRPRTVVVLGMGAAGLAGDLLAAVAGPTCPVPILRHRGFGLPTWVGAADLVIAVSSSGRTAETASALEEAVRRGCRLLVVTNETSPIAELGHRGRGVVVPVPPGRPASTALWAMSIPLLLAAEALSLISLPVGIVQETALALELVARRCGPATELVLNPAKTLALDLLDTLPVLWGSSPLPGVAAYRGACQLSEHAGLPAVWGTLPEAGHHQVGLLGGSFVQRDAADLFADPFEDELPAAPRSRVRLVLLRAEGDSPALTERAQRVHDLAQDRGVALTTLLGTGGSPLERLAVLIGTLDFAAAYLALLSGTDTGPATAINFVKGNFVKDNISP